MPGNFFRRPPKPTVIGTYGCSVAGSDLANTTIDTTNFTGHSVRFTPPKPCTLTQIRRYTITTLAGGYGGGGRGTSRVDICSDDGTTSHFPNQGASLANYSFVPPADSSDFSLHTLSANVVLNPGTWYHAVTTNTDATPATNWFSTDDLYDYLDNYALAPELDPRLDPLNMRVLAKTGSTWSATVQGRDHFPAIMEFICTDGTSFGTGYMESGSTTNGSNGNGLRTMDGTQAVREIFTVSGADRIVNAFNVRVIRSSGSGDLLCTLTQGGARIWQKSIGAAALPTNGWNTAGDKSINAKWVGLHPCPKTVLRSGTTYEWTFSTTAGSVYWMHPMRDGKAAGYSFLAGSVFDDGRAQYTTDGTTWQNWDTWGTNSTDQDLRTYFQVVKQ